MTGPSAQPRIPMTSGCPAAPMIMIHLPAALCSATNDRSPAPGRQISLRLQDSHALFLQILYDLFIMNDRAVGIDLLSARVLNLLIHSIHCSFNAETEAGVLRYFNPHSFTAFSR